MSKYLMFGFCQIFRFYLRNSLIFAYNRLANCFPHYFLAANIVETAAKNHLSLVKNTIFEF